MYFTSFLRLLGSCGRLAAYVFHIFWWPDLHENNIIRCFLGTFWPHEFLSNLFWQTLPLSGKSRKRCILGFFDNFRAPGVCFPRTARTQPSRNHCNLHAFWLLSGPWIPFEILLPILSLIRKIMKTLYFTAFWSIHTWSMDSVRKVVFVPLAFCCTSFSFR